LKSVEDFAKIEPDELERALIAAERAEPISGGAA
jgi:hypothetical protein